MLERVTKERYQKISAMLARRQPDLSVLAENVHKPHNLSAILRSCDAVGVGVVHAVGPTGGVPTFNETSASAEKWVELRVHTSLKAARAALGEVRFLAAHFSNAAKDYRDVDYTRPYLYFAGQRKARCFGGGGGLSRRARRYPDAGHGAILSTSRSRRQ